MPSVSASGRINLKGLKSALCNSPLSMGLISNPIPAPEGFVDTLRQINTLHDKVPVLMESFARTNHTTRGLLILLSLANGLSRNPRVETEYVDELDSA